jgi:hypothetical protein
VPTLYDEDVALWAEQQGRLLREAARRGSNEPIDWDHVAEEIETLGNSQVAQVKSRLSRIVEHLLKLQFSPATEPRRGWRDTVGQQRIDLSYVLDSSPSVRARLPDLLAQVQARAAREAARALGDWGEPRASAAALLHGGRYTLAEVLEDWPPEPGEEAADADLVR